MIAIIGAIFMLVVITISILLLCGLPLGELTMGGQYRVFPKKMKPLLVTQLVLQIFFVVTIFFIVPTCIPFGYIPPKPDVSTLSP